MKSTRRTSPLIASIALALFVSASLGVLFAASGSAPGGSPVAENKYIGADKCKSCHSAADSGDQYSHWKAMDHAKAFERLASEEAKKVGAAKGIADPQKSDECVRCHVTAFGVPDEQLKKGFDRTQGVQCETCHGPGEQHMKARFAAASKGETPQGYVQVAADEIISAPKQDTCLKCHNEQSPSFKRFCYHESLPKIRHVNPKKPREAGALQACGCKEPCGCTKGCPDTGCGVAQAK